MTPTSLLHFMTLLPAETTRSVSLKVSTDVPSQSVSLTNGMRAIYFYVIVSSFSSYVPHLEKLEKEPPVHTSYASSHAVMCR